MNHYGTIFRRKSFHSFKNTGNEHLTQAELDGIAEAYKGFSSLYPDIKTAIRIVPAGMLKRDAEYCILIYSEKKENYLMNAGYIGEQLDFYLVEHNIGSLWFGFGLPDKRDYEGLSFVIMMLIRKVSDETKYRRNILEAKRKTAEEIWQGDDSGLAGVARFAPSACNSQPWRVKNEDGKLSVFRFKKPGRVGIMPARTALYFNRIDMGIFLYVLELCMEKKELTFERSLFADDGEEREFTKVAEYGVTTKSGGFL